MINVGVLTSRKTKDSDEQYTPHYAVDPLLPYVELYANTHTHTKTIIWCPFDLEWSVYVMRFKELGYTVISSHIDDGQDFFTYEPEHYDIIISNPPFSQKDKVLKRLDELGKPFAVLLPINSLQGKYRFNYMDNIQLMFFNERIGFHNKENMDIPVEGSPFASGYFCKNFLPKDLIGLKLKKYRRKLND